MGLFYINNNEELSSVSKRRQLEEVKELANECNQIGKLSSNDIFPEFLWKPQLNNYENDDYKLRGTCDNPNVLKAYTIRRKYSNYWDYIDALDAYYDYVEYVDSAFGSFEMMKNAADNGFSQIYIPKKPKLTNKKQNKLLLKSGFIPSRIMEEFIPDDDIINDEINYLESMELVDEEGYEPPKRIQKLYKREMESKIQNTRISSIYASNGSGMLQGVDAIISFLTNPNNTSIDERNATYKSLTEEIESLHEFDYIPQDIIDEMFTPKTSYINSAFVLNPEKQRQQEILIALTTAGYNFLDKAVTAGMDKEVVRAVTRKYGDSIKNYDNLSPKQIKKLKKKEAKKRKKMQEKLIGDRRLTDALLRNRIHLSRDDNLNFRLCDVIKED